MYIRRLASALVLAALTLAGTATAASASAPPPSPTHSLAGTYRQAPTPLQACKRALVRAHDMDLSGAEWASVQASEHTAYVTCQRLHTPAQTDALVRWADSRAWVWVILG